MNKGFIFTLDAILALGLVLVLVGGIGIYFSIKPEMEYRNAHSQAEDGMELLSMQVRELGTYVDLKNDNLTESPNQTVLELIGSLWVSNKTEEARNVTKEVLGNYVENCFELTFSDETIYQSCPQKGDNIAISSRLASGYKTGGPSRGYVSRAFFDKLRKVTSEHAYFGGYVGDGNVTRIINLENMDSVLGVVIDADVGGSFDLYLNNNFSGSYVPSYENMSSDTFTVCNSTLNKDYCSLLESGSNTVKINFTSNQSSIRGGFIKFKYNTTEFITEEMADKYEFPGIDGLINLYSSIYVPGNLTGMGGKLHYKTDGTIFLKIGNATVYHNDTDEEVTVFLENSTINSGIENTGLEYDYLSKKTIPLRLGLEEMAMGKYRPIIDSVSVIDVSGSMDGSKLNEAKDASKTFSDVILNVSGNRIGVVAYESIIDTVQELTDDDNKVESTVDGLDAYGGTCIGCGILESIDVLDDPKYENIIAKKSDWKYNTSYPLGEPPTINNNSWVGINYDDSSWEENHSILGFGPNADTTIENNGGNYFFRKTFYYDVEKYKDVKGYLRSEDFANLYINGYLINNDTSKNDGKYWNIITGEFSVDDISGFFEDSYERSTLGSNWIIDTGSEGDEIDINSICGGTMGSNSVSLRWNDAILVSDFNLQEDEYVTKIDYDFKQGGDSGGCENPENGDDVYVEYLDSNNEWQELKMHDGGENDPPEGSWRHYSFSTPEDGFHNDFKIRFRYTGGSGYDYDYWALDNFTFTVSEGHKVNEINESILNDGKNVVAVKLKNLNESETYSWKTDSNSEWNDGSFVNTTTHDGELKLEGIGSLYYDDFEDGNFNGWSCSGSCGVSSNCAEIGSYAGYINEESGSAYSPEIDLSQMNNANISYWIKKGSDGCSEEPDGWEDLYAEYYNEDGDWTQLDFFDCGSIADGSSQIVEHQLPSDALHPNFKVRFRLRSGSGSNFDYWHFDEVKVEGASSEKTNGNYISKTFDAGQNVSWIESEISNITPAGTQYKINYSDTENWYKDIDEVPKSRYLKFNISMKTENPSKTPKIDLVNITYKSNEVEFDFKLEGSLKRNKSMVVMSDGEANEETDMENVPDHNSNGYIDAKDHTIEAACRAKEDHNITVYAVGFGTGADEETLGLTADCGEGEYYYSSTGELESIFKNISETLLELSFVKQEAEITGDFTSILYPDSYINYSYTAKNDSLKYGETSLTLESSPFGGNVTSPINGSFEIPENTRPLGGKVTSYSADYWTDRLLIKNMSTGDWNHIYRLWNFDESYQSLGDPYYVHIPREMISQEHTNHVSIDTAVSENETKGGSPDNRVIFQVAFKNSVPYTDVYPKAEGSTRKIYYDIDRDGSAESSVYISIGPNSSDIYDPEQDAIDDALSRLMDRLNFIDDTGADDGNSTNPIDIKIPEVKFDDARVGGVKWLWGPNIFTLKVW
ncbi:MAG: VWA domain-containing protein [Candidatus Aenigmatarchaeota archaeon]